MAASKLTIYNAALQLLGLRELSSTSEDRKSRHALDQAFDYDLVTSCLELAKPAFAVTSATSLSGSATASGTYGYYHTLSIPSPVITVLEVFGDVDVDNVVERWQLDGKNLLCDFEDILFTYVTDASATTYADWTPAFTDFVAAKLAYRVGMDLAPRRVEFVTGQVSDALKIAIQVDSESRPMRRGKISSRTLTTHWLKIYNDALFVLGLDEITSITDGSSRRAKLDRVFDAKLVEEMLEVVKPVFATVSISSTSLVTTGWRYDHEFVLPDNYVTTVGLYSDVDFNDEIDRFLIDETSLYADPTTVYHRYIEYDTSTHTPDKWSPTFARLVSMAAAHRIASAVAPDRVDMVAQLEKDALAAALAVEQSRISPKSAKSTTRTLTTDWLNVYNHALFALGLDEITSTSTGLDRRSKLDRVFDTGLVSELLELIKPTFASTTTQLTAVSATSYRYDNLFNVPSDLVAIIGVYADADLDDEVERYIIEGGSLFCDLSAVYIRYIEASTYALTPSSWSPTFSRLVALKAAQRVAPIFAPERADVVAELVKEAQVEAVAAERDRELENKPITPTVTLTNSWRRIYNDALSIMELEPLASNDSDADRKVKIDRVLDARLVESILEDIGWQFALTSVKLDYNSSVEPEWGYQYAFDKPSDLLRIEGVYGDEHLNSAIRAYHDEDGYILCNYSEIYLQYVSSDYLTTPDSWPAFFARLVAARMAKDAAGSIRQANTVRADEEYLRRYHNARTNDSLQSPSRVIRGGSWVKVRTTGLNSHNRPGD